MDKEIINDKRCCCPLCGSVIEIGEKCLESTWIDRYLYDNHYDNDIDDIEVKCQNMTYPQLAEMIYNEEWEAELNEWANAGKKTMNDVKVK